MSAKKRSLLDSYALLAYLKKESNYEKVMNLLKVAQDKEQPLLMNEINVGETFYILARERSFNEAESFLEFFPVLPIKQIPNLFEHVLNAARIKAKYSISYADCFAVMTALEYEASIVTGDPEFKKVEDMIQIDWL